jgi:hypothetical protein
MEDLARLTLRELMTLARERLGSAASRLKTRAELLAALSAGEGEGEAPAPDAVLEPVAPMPVAPVQVVTRDFFRRRT